MDALKKNIADMLELEQTGVENIFELLLSRYKEYGDEAGVKLLKTSYELGRDAHKGQMRGSGAEYFTHPLLVAYLLIIHLPDAEMLSAAMLHDVIEDTPLTERDLQKTVGVDVAKMVRALSKINIPFEAQTDQDKVTKNLYALRTILQSSKNDVRILCIKLADRFHNMITLGGKKSAESQMRIAQETLDIYVPLARRVGMWFFYQSLKYLSYKYTQPTELALLEKKYALFGPTERQVTQALSKELHASVMRADVQLCESTFRDVLKPYLIKAPELLEPEDFFLFHISVATDKDIFFLLSELGSCSRRISLSSARDKNFVAHVKSSGYQAYHTTIVFDGKYRIRLRIQSEEMHKQTRGPQAMEHIIKSYPEVLFQDLAVIDDATESGSPEFMQAVRKHLLDERIPVHIPGEDNVRIPRDFSVYDAAWYLYPEKAPFLSEVYRNKTLVDKNEPIRVDDILEFVYGDEETVQLADSAHITSTIAKYRLSQYLHGAHTEKTRIREGYDHLQKYFEDLRLGSAHSFLAHKKVVRKLGFLSRDAVYESIGSGLLAPVEVAKVYDEYRSQSLFVRSVGKFSHLFPSSIKGLYNGFTRRSVTFSYQEGLRDNLSDVMKQLEDDTDLRVAGLQTSKTKNGYGGKVKLDTSDRGAVFDWYVAMMQHGGFTNVHTAYTHRTLFLGLLYFNIWSLFVLTNIAQFFGYLGLYGFSIILPFVFFSVHYFLYAQIIKILPQITHKASVPILSIVLFLVYISTYFFSFVYEGGMTNLQLTLLISLTIIGVFMLAFKTYKSEKVLTDSTKYVSSINVQQKIIGYSMRFFAVCIWGTIPLVIRYIPGVENVSVELKTSLYIFGQVLILAMTVFFVFIFKRSRPQLGAKVSKHFFLMVVGVSCYIFFMHASLSTVNSVDFNVISNFAPITLLVLGILLWKKEIPYLNHASDVSKIFVLFILGGIGTSLIVANGATGSSVNLGHMFAILAMLSTVLDIGAKIRFAKKNPKMNSVLFTLMLMFTISCVMLAFVLPYNELFNLSKHQILLLLSVGSLAGIGTVLNFESFKRIDGLLSFLMFNISILVSFFGELMLGGNAFVTPLLIFGSVLIVIASIGSELINTSAEKRALS